MPIPSPSRIKVMRETVESLSVISINNSMYLGVINLKDNEIESAIEISLRKLQKKDIWKWMKAYNVGETINIRKTDLFTKISGQAINIRQLNPIEKGWVDNAWQIMKRVKDYITEYMENKLFDDLLDNNKNRDDD